MSKKEIELKKEHELILKVFEDNSQKVYTPKQLATQTGYTSGSISNCLKELLEFGKIIRISRGKYQFNHQPLAKNNQTLLSTEEKTITELEKYLNSEDIKDTQFKTIFLDILQNKIPLGIHYLLCHRRNISIDYDTIDWDIVNTKNGEKDCEIPNVKEFGKTVVKIWAGKSNDNKPAMSIEYNGDIGTQKLYLKENDYPIWLKGVEDFLLLKLGLNITLDSFFLKRMDINMDFEFKKLPEKYKNFKNVRIPHLSKVYELYRHSKGKYLRVGLAKSTNKDEVTTFRNNPFLDFFNWDADREQEKRNLTNSVINIENSIQQNNSKIEEITKNEINPLKESLKSLKEDNSKQIEEIKQSLDGLQEKNLEVFREEFKNNHELLKKEILSNSQFLLEEFSPVVRGLEDFKKEYDSDSFEIARRFDSHNENIVKIGQIVKNLEGFVQQTNLVVDKITKLQKQSEDNKDQVITRILDLINTNYDNVLELFRQKDSSQNSINIEHDEKFNKLYNLWMKQMEKDLARRKKNEGRLSKFLKKVFRR